jgi:hypothetical protein
MATTMSGSSTPLSNFVVMGSTLFFTGKGASIWSFP